MKVLVVVEENVGYPISLFENARKEVAEIEAAEIKQSMFTLCSNKVLSDINDLVIVDYESIRTDAELNETVYICKPNIGKHNNVEVNTYHVKGLDEINKIMILENVYSEINWG